MTGAVVAQTVVSSWGQSALIAILGFGLLATVASTAAAFAYRRYSTRALPTGVGVLLGASIVGAWLNVRSLGGSPIVGDVALIGRFTALYLLGALVVSAVGAELGRRIGDRLSCDVYGVERLDATGRPADLVRSAGMAVAIELPETIEDADGYPPVSDAVKRRLAGRTMVFPRRLDAEELRSRLIGRIERDFGVGYVSADVTDDGAVDYLAVGAHRSGIGPTLPPETAAVAIDCDPASEASPGDPVEVWMTEGETNRLAATGRLRSRAGDVATIVVDADDADAFDLAGSDGTYRLATRPDAPNDAGELAAALRAADETVRRVSVSEGGPLDGEFVGWLPVRTLAVDRDGDVRPFPDDSLTLRGGDEVYGLGTPAELRELAEYERDRSREREPIGAVGEDADTEGSGADTDDGDADVDERDADDRAADGRTVEGATGGDESDPPTAAND